MRESKEPILILIEENGRIRVECLDTEIEVYTLDQRHHGEPPTLLKAKIINQDISILANAYKNSNIREESSDE